MTEVFKLMPGTIEWCRAMTNANIADKDFKPQAKRSKLNKSDIAKLLKVIKNDSVP